MKNRLFTFLIPSAVCLLLLFQECLAQEYEKPIEGRSRGLDIPKNLTEIVEKQTRLNIVSSLIVESVPKRPSACQAKQSQFDWRDLKKVTPVQDQGRCGSCWDFAASAAYESSFLIENDLNSSLTDPGKLHLSEQEGLDCAAASDSCAGGWPDAVFDYLIDSGETSTTRYGKYIGQKKVCANVPLPPREFFALQWGAVDKDNIPSDIEIKSAICERGPIVVAVNSNHWDDLTEDQNYYRYSLQNPNFRSEFPDGVFKGSRSDPALSGASLKTGDVDHEVIIVGWNDARGAWIVKNSWGTFWGMKGFMLVKYGTSNIGFAAAWVRASNISAPLSDNRIDALKKANAAFKSSVLRTQQ